MAASTLDSSGVAALILDSAGGTALEAAIARDLPESAARVLPGSTHLYAQSLGPVGPAVRTSSGPFVSTAAAAASNFASSAGAQKRAAPVRSIAVCAAAEMGKNAYC